MLWKKKTKCPYCQGKAYKRKEARDKWRSIELPKSQKVEFIQCITKGCKVSCYHKDEVKRMDDYLDQILQVSNLTK